MIERSALAEADVVFDPGWLPVGLRLPHDVLLVTTAEEVAVAEDRGDQSGLVLVLTGSPRPLVDLLTHHEVRVNFLVHLCELLI